MKRIALVAFVLLAMLAMTLATAASAPQKIKSLHPAFAGQLRPAEMDGVATSIGQLADLRTYPGSELHIYLVGSDNQPLFYDQVGEPIGAADITAARLLAAQIGLQVSQEDAAGTILDTTEIAYGTDGPYIRLCFAEELVSLADRPFSLSLSLCMAGQELEQTRLTVGGVMQATVKSASPGESAVDLTDGSVFLAGSDTQMQLLLGEDISLMAQVRAGEKYYARVRVTETETPPVSEIAKANSKVTIYTLYTLNVDRTNSTVRIQTDTPQYVYDEARQYLGTTRDPLPYAEQYIVCSQPGFPAEL